MGIGDADCWSSSLLTFVGTLAIGLVVGTVMFGLSRSGSTRGDGVNADRSRPDWSGWSTGHARADLALIGNRRSSSRPLPRLPPFRRRPPQRTPTGRRSPVDGDREERWTVSSRTAFPFARLSGFSVGNPDGGTPRRRPGCDRRTRPNAGHDSATSARRRRSGRQRRCDQLTHRVAGAICRARLRAHARPRHRDHDRCVELSDVQAGVASCPAARLAKKCRECSESA